MKMKRIITALLAFVFLLSATACKEEEEDTPVTQETARKTSTIVNDDFNGTGNYLVSNGKTEYSLVLPTEADVYEEMAANEFNQFITQSTGVSFEIVSESEITYSASSKYILFGNTEAAKEQGVEAKKEDLKATGYALQTVGSTLFVVGASATGTLYATYDLLTALVEFRSYTIDTIYVKENVTEIELKNYNFRFCPTIETRQSYIGTILGDVTFSHRMKNIVDTDLWAKVGGLFCHTATKLVPETEREAHPEWFGTDGAQLCYSEGLENEEMFDYLYANLKSAIEAAPRAKYVSISQADVASWCACTRCQASKLKYGSNLAVIIKFCNKAARKVKEDFPNRDLYVHTFSYHETSSAITFIDDEVMCEPNVTVMLAPIRANYTAGFSDKTNLGTLNALQAIAKICSHVTVWGYDYNFPNYFLGYNSFGGRQDRYNVMSENNVSFLFDQGLFNTTGATGFSELKVFLTANLSWDNSLDYESLVDEFFERYFGDGATAMRKYFDEYRSWTLYAYNELGMSKDINGSGISDSGFWPKGTAKQWLSHIEEAYEDIAYLKWTDAESYQKLYDHIRMESLLPRYVLIKFYGSSFSSDELLQMKKDFKEDCYKYKVLRASEGGTVETLFSDWGV